ncbi:MAG: hypothetical protein PHO66_05035 [Eubacteriales bacterium]|nr:hypothetical protein [Eubacteriales bacterium]
MNVFSTTESVYFIEISSLLQTSILDNIYKIATVVALVDETRLEYTLPVADAEAAQHLMRMTPLAENAPSEMTFSDKDITFSMNIYIGRVVG